MDASTRLLDGDSHSMRLGQANRLHERGEWRLTTRWVTPFLWPTYRVDRFPEGTVYGLWVGWLFVKLMVKSDA